MNHSTLYSQTGSIWFTAERDWKQNMHYVAHFLVYHVLAKFQLFCIITYRDILYFVFWLPYCHTLWRHLYLICIIQKSWISLEWDEKGQKGKHHSSSLLKGFQIRLFFNTSIFHVIGTLTAKCKWSTTPDKTVEAFQYNFKFCAMVPSCPKETNSSPSPLLVQCCFGLAAQACILCYCKQQCNRGGGKQ